MKIIGKIMLILVVLSTFAYIKKPKDVTAPTKMESTHIVLDTFDNEVFLCYDVKGYPTHYISDVFTPVCNTGECLPIKILLYWDLAGNFSKFELPGTEILTKLDHIPFTPEDYRMLQSILSNPSSELKKYSYDDINFSDDTTKVDGVSGATIKGLKGHYVPDALYSSHTLWHLSNGGITYKLANYTKENIFTKYPIEYFVNNKQTNCQGAALKHIANNQETDLSDLLLTVLDSANESLSNLAITMLPNTISTPQRNQLAAHYSNTSYNSDRELILAYWEAYDLNEKEINVITQNFGKVYSLFKKECFLLDKQRSWPDATYNRLLEFVNKEANLKRKEAVFLLLMNKESEFTKAFRKTFKKTAKQQHFVL